MQNLTTPKTVSVTELRNNTKAVLQTVMTSDEPIYILYHSKMPICLMRADALQAYLPISQSKQVIQRYAGFLKKSPAFSGNAVQYQRKLRKGWNRHGH